jgi:hypothetical protein
MEPTIALYATTLPELTKPRERAPAPAARIRPLAAPPRALGLFRRAQPTTFHRFLAVHMHFAAHASALD